MFKLQNLNIVKLVETENERDKLITKGFEIVEEKEGVGNESINYAEMTVPDLQALCKEKGLSGYSTLSKDDLVKFIEEKLATEGTK